jgi:hypothetical protein
MAETAAHLVDHVFPPLPVRQWVLAVPKRLRYFLQRGTRGQWQVYCSTPTLASNGVDWRYGIFPDKSQRSVNGGNQSLGVIDPDTVGCPLWPTTGPFRSAS